MVNRQLIVECLEARQLMAVDFETGLPWDSQASAPWLYEPNQDANPDNLLDTSFLDLPSSVGDLMTSNLPWVPEVMMAIPFVSEMTSPNFILETSDRVVVADNWGYQASSIWILDRTAEGLLANAREIQLDFQVEQQWIIDDRLIVAGWPWSPEDQQIWWPTEQYTAVVSIDLENATELSRELLSGSLIQAFPVSNGLLVQTQVNGNYPMPIDDIATPNDALARNASMWNQSEPWNELAVLQSTEDGLEKIWMEPSRPGTLQANGDQVVFLTADFSIVDPWEATNPDNQFNFWAPQLFSCDPMLSQAWYPRLKSQLLLKHYQVTDSGLETISLTSLNGAAYDGSRIQLADDGKHVLVTWLESQWDENGQWFSSTHLDWYGLGLETPQVIAQTDLPNFYGEVKLLADQRAIAVSSMASQEVLLIDFNSSTADDQRVTRVALAEELQLSANQMVVQGDHLILGGSTPWQPQFDLPTVDDVAEPESYEERLLVDPVVDPPTVMEFTDESNAALVVISLAESRVLSETILDGTTAAYQLFSIDPTTAKLGWVSIVNEPNWQWREQVSFGYVSSEGNLVDIQDVAGQDSWAFYESSQQALYTLSNNRLRVIHWSNPGEIRQLVPLFNPETDIIIANPDAFERVWSTESQTLDVLSNDSLPRSSRFSTKVIELIDAPNEFSLDEYGQVLIPAGFQVSTQLTFQYLISDNHQQSVSTVTLDPTSSELTVIVEQVRLQAAEDLSVPIDEIVIESVTHEGGNFDQGIPYDSNNPAEDWGVIIAIQAPTAMSRYLVSTDGTIELIEREELTPLLETNRITDEMDINGDGFTTALDVLHVVNILNQYTPLQAANINGQDKLVVACDIDGDHSITVADAMMIIDRLNSYASTISPASNPSEEGEQSPSLAERVDAAIQDWSPGATKVALPVALMTSTIPEFDEPFDFGNPLPRRRGTR